MFRISTHTMPTLPNLTLSEQERDLITDLFTAGQEDPAGMALCRAFYLGRQVIKNLRIAVPKELEPYLDAVVGWPAVAVDPLVERMGIDGMRVPGGDDTDRHLSELITANGLDAELPIAFTDSFSMGSAFFSVGSPDETDGPPVMTVDSPLNVWAKWDLRGRVPSASLHTYQDSQQSRAVLQMPRLALHLAQNDKGEWEITKRDEHGFDFVPVVRMPNMPLSDARHGRSEITPSIRAHTVDASRALRSLAVAGELYSIPQRLILGATESAFQNADGTAKKALETYITSVLALERDDNGELPDVKQMAVYDPSVYTRVIDMHASRVAGDLAAMPQDLGLYTEGNPPSEEAVKASESRRDRRARLRQKYANPYLARFMQMGLRFENGGRLPDEYRFIKPDWDLDSLSPSASASDAISKQVSAGVVPPESDVVLKKLGYNAVERQQLEDDARRGRVAAASRRASEAMSADANGV